MSRYPSSSDCCPQRWRWGLSVGYLAIVRLTAYAEAGADCLYAPGIRTKADIAAVVRAVAPKPVNVLVGGALARAAWTGFLEAAKDIREWGTFTSLARAVSFAAGDGAFAPK